MLTMRKPGRPTTDFQRFLTNHDWQKQATCKDAGPTLFYPDIGSNFPTEAYALCARCPVAVDCLTAAMIEEGDFYRGARHGLRAGVTPRLRELLDMQPDNFAFVLLRVKRGLPVTARHVRDYRKGRQPK